MHVTGRSVAWFILLGSALAGGCVERTLTITSSPSGAMVWVNGQEFGRTPVTRDFTWYGDFDIALRKEGFEPHKVHRNVRPPIWQWVPIDFVAEILPFHFRDERKLHFALQPTTTPAVDPEAILARARDLRAELRSSELTRSATRPTTRPTTRPAGLLFR